MKTTSEWAGSGLSRREFLCAAAVAAGAGAAALYGRSPQATTRPAHPAELRIGLATYTWGKDWDIPTLIANGEKAGLLGVELRTCEKYAHGVETTLSAEQRAEVKKRFADSPVKLVSIACSERFDWPEADKLKAATKAAKEHLQLSHDVGCDVVRVFPNSFHPKIPHEKTIEQIARAMDQLGAFADGLGQEVSLEAHGPVGELPNMRAIMDRTQRRNIRVRLNCDARDNLNKGFAANFDLVKAYLSRVIHIHDLQDAKYPYQLMVELLIKAGWRGWALMERSEAVPDRVVAMTQERQRWEKMVQAGTAKVSAREG